MCFAQDTLTSWIQLGFTFIAGIYALMLLKQSNKDKKTQFINDIFKQFYNDDEIKKLLYAVDSGNDDEEIKFGGKLEQEGDKTIRYLDYIGYLIKEKHLKRSDINAFNYEVKRILGNEYVKKYIEDWLKKLPNMNLDNLKYL